MRLSDIDKQLHESVNEAPVGMLKRAGTAMKAKFGMGATKAIAKGEQDTSTMANALYKDFYTYAGKQGMKQPDLPFVLDYLTQVGFAPNTIQHVQQGTDFHGPLGKKQIGDVMLKAVQKRAKNQQGLGKTAYQNLEPGGQQAGGRAGGQTLGQKNVADANSAAADVAADANTNTAPGAAKGAVQTAKGAIQGAIAGAKAGAQAARPERPPAPLTPAQKKANTNAWAQQGKPTPSKSKR